MRKVVAVGACYLDTILSVPHFPSEDSKLRALEISRRRGGNCPNSLEVLQQLNNLESSQDQCELILCAVLPAGTSTATADIKESLGPNINTHHCICRNHVSEPAASYIIRSLDNNSRTIVNYNALAEMTTQEFKDVADELGEDAVWYHFEGRIPEVSLGCIQYLRQKYPEAKVSVEVEKPGREGLQEMAAEADVVFYSKSWAQSQGFHEPRQFLQERRQYTPKASILCCTWAEEGANILQASREEDRIISVAAFKGRDGVVDTIGAGDTFIAGMLYGFLFRAEDWTLKEKLEFGNELAGRKVSQEGFGSLGEKMATGIKR